MRCYRCFMVGALAVGLLAGPASAAVVSVDHGAGIGDYSGTGPLGGGTWNHKSAQEGFDVTVAGLVDSTGTLTGVTYRMVNANGTPATVDSSMAGGDPATASMLNDYRVWTTDVTIGNLVPGASYDLALFGTRYDGSTVHNTTFTVGGTPTTTTAVAGDMSGWTAGKTYVSYTGVQADANGQIAIQTDGRVFSGFQLDGTVTDTSGWDDWDVVNVDFGTGGPYEGTGAAPDSGTFWNAATSTSGSFLIASDGTTPTTVGFTSTGDGSRFGTRGSGGGIDLFTDYHGNWGVGAWDLTVTGLDDSALYDLYLYASDDATGDGTVSQGATFTLDGQSGRADSTNRSTFVQDENYVLFQNVSASGGQIVINVTDPEGVYLTNGFQIVRVPEPASVMLLAFAVAGLLSWRRR